MKPLSTVRTVVTGLVLIAAPVFVSQTHGASVIDPTGASYTSASASSQFPGYGPRNLFNFDVTSISPGTSLSDASEWATLGQLDAFVAFHVGGIYSVSSLFFAERDSGGRPDTDQMGVASIWASQTTPFDPNSPPATNPDAFIVLMADGTPTWREYLLTNTILGQYFLIRFVQTNGTCCNPGGRELRLGGMLFAAIPPSIAQNPANHTIYAGGTAHFSVFATGTTPLSYQWKTGSTVLGDDSRISGSASASLRITSAVAADAGSYSCTVTNRAGVTNSSAGALTVLAPPASTMANLIMSNTPLGYYRFQESAGASVALDTFGCLDAAYGADSVLGGAGPQPPTFPGFDSTNTDLGTLASTPTSTVTVPALNLNTNTVSMLAWLYPDGPQTQYASLISWRSSATFGLHYLNSTTLTYIWNNDRYYIDSGLVIPTNQWSLVGLVVTPTNATLYLGTDGVLRFSVDTFNEVPAAFDSTTQIGCDNLADTTRVFNGLIDEVAIFSHALTPNQVQAIYAAGVGTIPPGISQPPVSHTNYTGGTDHFSVEATGSSLSFQWKKGTTPLADGGNISGAHTPILAIANLTGGDAGSYSCVVSNSLGPLPSSSATLTVIPAPTAGYHGRILTYKPVAFWQLDEASGASTAVDYVGSYDGGYGPNSALGVNGPQTPTFPGFGNTNTALQTLFNSPDSAVGVPPLNLNANTVTVLAWINPSGPQNPYTTMFMSRASGTIAGLNYFGDGVKLGYQWNGGRFDFDSGLAIQSDQWSFIGMMITPTNGTLYLASNGGPLLSSAQTINQAPEGFFGVSSIGRDNAADANRVFNGVIDSVAVFNRSLSTADITAIYNGALGAPPLPTTLGWSVSPSGLVLTWYGPWTLIQADSVTGPCSAATGVTSGVPIPMSAAQRFYRLQF